MHGVYRSPSSHRTISPPSKRTAASNLSRAQFKFHVSRVKFKSSRVGLRESAKITNIMGDYAPDTHRGFHLSGLHLLKFKPQTRDPKNKVKEFLTCCQTYGAPSAR